MSYKEMSYEEFVNQLKETLTETLGEGYRLEETTVRKNNGVRKEGLAVKKEGVNAAPVLYLKEMYEEVCAGEPLSKAAEKIRIAVKEGTYELQKRAAWGLWKFSSVKDSIVFQLVNGEKNREDLKDFVTMPFLDLLILFVIRRDCGEETAVTIKIPKMIQEEWNVSTQELYEIALKNMQRDLPAQLQSLKEVLGEEEKGLPAPPLSVLTNSAACYGAGCILYSDLIKGFSDTCNRDVLILPSSVHEILLLVDNEIPAEELEQMVREINRTELSPEAVLSDRVYRYNRVSGKIEYAIEENRLKEAV